MLAHQRFIQKKKNRKANLYAIENYLQLYYKYSKMCTTFSNNLKKKKVMKVKYSIIQKSKVIIYICVLYTNT